MSSKDLQIDWLRAFLAVVDKGSMTSAGKQIARSQSAVSMQIKKLEDSVGRPLLNRSSGNFTLTPAGYDLLIHARNLMEIHANALATLHGSVVGGRVIFGVPDDYVAPYLAPILKSFTMRYQEVGVTLVCEPSTVLISKTERGEVDLSLISRDVANRGELLFNEDLIWVGNEKYEAWKKNPIPIAVHGLNNRLRNQILMSLREKKKEYQVIYNSPNILGQLAIASSGLGVSVITRCNLTDDLKVLDMRHGLPKLPSVEVALLRSEKSKKSKAVSALEDYIIEKHSA